MTVYFTLSTQDEVELIFSNSSVKIVDSYKYNKKKLIKEIVAFVEEYVNENNIIIERNSKVLYGEIRLHNICYYLGIARSSTKDCDLDLIADSRWYVNLCSAILGYLDI